MIRPAGTRRTQLHDQLCHVVTQLAETTAQMRLRLSKLPSGGGVQQGQEEAPRNRASTHRSGLLGRLREDFRVQEDAQRRVPRLWWPARRPDDRARPVRLFHRGARV